ncbi:MAG: hypothetical protein ACRYF9_11220 [Janthinobacterium lividum]
MIKSLLFTFGLALLGANALAAAPSAPANAIQAQAANLTAIDKHGILVSNIDEDRVMAERLKG